MRDWLWRDPPAPLDFSGAWPDDWSIVVDGDPHTTWHRWLPAAGGPLPAAVLACTGTDAATPADWPDVTYGNGADATLASPPLRTGGMALRLVHALDADLREPGIGSDGAVVEAMGADGVIRTLTPLDGYGGRVARDVDNPLLGRPAFVGPGELDAAAAPLWKVDLFPLPDVDGGWSRLRLRFASDPLWRGRGWLVADIALVPAAELANPFRATWSPADDALRIVWPDETPERVYVDASADAGANWSPVWEGAPPPAKEFDMLVPAPPAAVGAGRCAGRADAAAGASAARAVDGRLAFDPARRLGDAAGLRPAVPESGDRRRCRCWSRSPANGRRSTRTTCAVAACAAGTCRPAIPSSRGTAATATAGACPTASICCG